MITEQKIKEGNKLIAEFMGYTVYEKRYPRNHGIGAYGHSNAIIPKDCILEKLKYHISWDWIMPVVSKIEDLDYRISSMKVQKGLYTIILCGDEDNPDCYPFAEREIEMIKKDRLSSMYIAVVEFIKWNNTQKSKKNHKNSKKKPAK